MNVVDKPTLQKMLDLYKIGKSDIQIMKELSLTKKEFNDMYENSPAFRMAVDKGRVFCEAWWTEQGQGALNDRTFNAGVWQLFMKNRFGWSEKSEVNQQAPDSKKSEEELRKELKETYERLYGSQGTH